jgi:hypothetical protein
MVHLQEMKDEMIAVANELLDDDGELNLQRSEELRKKRFDSLSYSSSVICKDAPLFCLSNTDMCCCYILQIAS